MLHTMSRQLAPAILLAAFTFNLPARAGDTVPIHGQGTLTGTGESVDPATGNLIISIVLDAEASHLGHTTGTGTQITYAPDYIQFTLTMTQVAANRDELFVTYEGTFINSNFDALGTFQITGGTGRFVGASGYGIFAGFSGGAQVFETGVITRVGGD